MITDEKFLELAERVNRNQRTNNALFRAINSISTYTVDLEDEMITVITEGGKTVSATDMTIGLHAYYGTTDITDECTVTTGDTPEGVTLTPSATDKSRLRLQIAEGTALAGMVRLQIKCTHVPYGERIKYFTINAVSGTLDTPIYQIASSLSAFRFERDANNQLTPDTRRVTFQVKISRGGTTSILPLKVLPNIKVEASTEGMPEAPASGITYFDMPKDKDMLYVAMFNGTQLVDMETIPSVYDGIRGADAEDFKGEWDAYTRYTKGDIPLTVTHLGYKWYLLVDSDRGTEPFPFSSVWGLMNGSLELGIELDRENALVRRGNINLTVEPHLFAGFIDITRLSVDSDWYWEINTGNAQYDLGWKNAHRNQRILTITDNILPSQWKEIEFTCYCTYNGEETTYRLILR